MLAYIASLVSPSSQKREKISRFVSNSLSLNSISGLVFLRSLAIVLIAVLVWTGVQVQDVQHVSGNDGYVVSLGGDVWAATTGNNPSAYVADSKTKVTPASEGTTGVKTINMLINVMFALLTPLLMLAGWLLTPDWTFGEIFGLRPVFHDMWILVSNIVYIVFAFLLVAMAFMNIFGHEGNTWAIRAKLPRLIIGVISVPFTWLFVSAIVSISSILTASAIQLAWDLAPDGGKEFNFSVPTACTLDFTKAANGTATGSKFLDCGDSTATTSKPFSKFFESENAFGIVSYYAYGVFKFQDIKNITPNSLWSIQDIFSLTGNLLIALIMFVMFFLIIVALVFALFSRALYLWAISVFSPLLSLRYFFEGKLGGFGDKWLSVSSIIGLAMVPVYVAAALSVWLVFTSAVTKTTLIGNTSNYVTKVGPWENNSQMMTIMGTEYKIIGVPNGQGSIVWEATTLGGGVIWRLIVQLAALGILWFAVMAALKGSEVTKEAAAPIASFGADIGNLMKSLPKYAPIIPTGHGAASLNSLKGISNSVQWAVAQWASDRGREIWQSINKALGISSEANEKMQQARSKVQNRVMSSAPNDNINMFKEAIANGNLTSNRGWDPITKQLLSDVVNKSRISDDNDGKKRGELLTQIQGLTNDSASMDKFLKKFTAVAGNGDLTLDEYKEMDAIAKNSNTIASSSTPQVQQNLITINTAGGQSNNVPMNLTAGNGWLQSASTIALKKTISEAIANKTPAEQKTTYETIAKQIKDWLTTNGVVDPTVQKTILDTVDSNLSK